MVATYGGCHINIGKLTHVPFAWALVLVSFFLMPPPRRDPGLTPVYIDYVWGFSDTEAQHWMPPGIWVAALIILLPALLYVPVAEAGARMVNAAAALRRCLLLALSGHSVMSD